MSLLSIDFFLTLPIILIFYYILPFKFRRIYLLIISYLFYATFNIWFVVILFISTLIDYYSALQIKKNTSFKKKHFLYLGIISNLSTLFLFKYLNFFQENFKILFGESSFVLFKIILPIGISYYSFKKISYLIDVYREIIIPESNFVVFALYVSIFPELLAGPIDRAKDLIPQLYLKHNFEYIKFTYGLKLIVWGLFKKMVIADRFALFVNTIYNNPTNYSGPEFIAATIYFSIQIYCDFSGYTDIVLGIGNLFGFEFKENFNRPYLSKSIAEFWRRWHISLSLWLRDYLFIPISLFLSKRKFLNRFSLRTGDILIYTFSSMVTMLLCGLWHGAGWTFVLWGAIHGIYLTTSILTKKIRKKIRKIFGIKKKSFFYKSSVTLFVFTIVSFAWILFRANSASEAFYIIANIFSKWNISDLSFMHFGLSKKELIVGLFSFFILCTTFIISKENIISFISKKHIYLRWTFYIVLISWVIGFGETMSDDFIYFRF